jgi:hypothetical protein
MGLKMTKWLSRTVGTVGIASGFCLLAAGAAHADDAGAKPAQDPKGLHGLVDQLFTAGGDRLNNVGINGPGLGVAAQDLSVADPARVNHGVERDTPQHQVLTGQLPAFARTLPAPAAPSLLGGLGAPGQLPGVGALGPLGQLSGLGTGASSGSPTSAFTSNADNLPGITQQTVGNRATGNPLSTEDLRLLPEAPSAPTTAVDRGALGTTILSDGTGRRAEELPSLPVAKSVLDQVTVNGSPLTGGALNSSSLPLKPNLTVDPNGPKLPTPIGQAIGNPIGSLGLPAPAAKPATAAPKSEALPVVNAVPMVSNLAGQSTHMPGVSAVPMLKGLVTTTLTNPDQADPNGTDPTGADSSGTEALPVVDSLPVLGGPGGGLGSSLGNPTSALPVGNLGSSLGAPTGGLGNPTAGLGAPAGGSGAPSGGSGAPSGGSSGAPAGGSGAPAGSAGGPAAGHGGPAVSLPVSKSLPVVGGLLGGAPTAAAPSAATAPATVPASTRTAGQEQPVRSGGAHRAHAASSDNARPIAGEDADF